MRCMAEIPTRPSFVDALLTDLRDDYRRYGWRKLVPVWIIVSLAIGSFVAWQAGPKKLWGDDILPALALLGAITTLNGLFLALSWGSFAKIYEIASKPKFAAYLRKNRLLDTYFYLVDYIHAAQIIAVGMAAVGLAIAVVPTVPVIAKQVVLALVIATSIYALRYALGAVRLMQDLVWYSSIFENEGETPSVTVHQGGKGGV